MRGDMADAGEIDLGVSDSIIAEVLRVLRDDSQWSKEGLLEAQYQMNTVGRKMASMESVDAIREDPDDNIILECAAARPTISFREIAIRYA